MLVEISPGELLDKISILELKMLKIEDEDKLSNIKKEFHTLNPLCVKLFEEYGAKMQNLYLELEPIIREQSNLRNTTNIFKEVNEITKLKDIKDLAVEDFDTLDEVIQSLWHQSRREKQIVIEGEKLELEPIIKHLSTSSGI